MTATNPDAVKWLLTALAVLVLLTSAALAQTGTAPFCLQSPQGAQCSYGTMGACEQARGNQSSGQCITRTDAQGTTGLGERTNPGQGGTRLPPELGVDPGKVR